MVPVPAVYSAAVDDKESRSESGSDIATLLLECQNTHCGLASARAADVQIESVSIALARLTHSDVAPATG